MSMGTCMGRGERRAALDSASNAESAVCDDDAAWRSKWDDSWL